MAPARHLAKRLQAIQHQARYYSAPAERSIAPAKQKYVPSSGTYPRGFLAGSAHAGVKASNTKYDDIALVVSEEPCPAAAVFTRNLFQAAPVSMCRTTLERNAKSIRGVIVNSGCANAVTGTQGRKDAVAMAKTTDHCFQTGSSFQDPQMLVMSTGVIGQRLPMDRIQKAIPKAHASLGTKHEDWMKAAQAICTTDTFPKLLSRTFTLPSHPETEYRIAGMTKGAGMIHPNMGTLLGIVCTDAKIESTSMHSFLRDCVDRSFNAISIDGDTSTNDTVALLANGAAAPPTAEGVSLSITAGSKLSPDAHALQDVLQNFMVDLAQLVVRDGEGATKFVTIRVVSETSRQIARRIATSIATSSLVKTALYGKDANWGRILCAIGYAPGIMPNPLTGVVPSEAQGTIDQQIQNTHSAVQPERLSVSFLASDGSEALKLFTRGEPENVDEERAKEILEMEDLEILVRLEDDGNVLDVHSGSKVTETVWTCDLSHEYVTINGDYRT